MMGLLIGCLSLGGGAALLFAAALCRAAARAETRARALLEECVAHEDAA